MGGGGGVAKIDVNEVSARLQGLTEEYGNFFQIPPYFAYVLRAFSVLEGIALINDPDYSILQECLPYISQRVLTDNSAACRRRPQLVCLQQAAAGGPCRTAGQRPRLILLGRVTGGTRSDGIRTLQPARGRAAPREARRRLHLLLRLVWRALARFRGSARAVGGADRRPFAGEAGVTAAGPVAR